MIETAEPRDSESETSETIRSGPAAVQYSFETFSTSSKPHLRGQRLCGLGDALVRFQQPIGHVGGTVMLAHASETICAQLFREFSVTRDLQNAFSEVYGTVWPD